jgi:Tol biopolymer transport system component
LPLNFSTFIQFLILAEREFSLGRIWFILLVSIGLTGCLSAAQEITTVAEEVKDAEPSTTVLQRATEDHAESAIPTEIQITNPKHEGVIVFSQGYNEQVDALMIYNLADDSIQQIIGNLEVPIWDIRWAPDGEMLVFSSGIAGFEFYRIMADGTGLILLDEGGLSNYYVPLWSPDSQRVTVVKTDFFKDYTILSLSSDGSGQTGNYSIPVTNQSKLMDFKWAPNGTGLVFVGYEEKDNIYGLYLVNPDGSNLRTLTTSETQVKTPDWSPDGSMIVYEAGGDIFLLEIEGTRAYQISDNIGIDTFPVWSPDGLTIAFYSAREDGQQQLYMIDPDGENQRLVLDYNAKGDAINDLHWSPDGKYITVRSGLNLLVVDARERKVIGEIEDVFIVAWKP